jgi:hypothetical protein
MFLLFEMCIGIGRNYEGLFFMQNILNCANVKGGLICFILLVAFPAVVLC